MKKYVPDHVKERLELVSWGKAIQGIHNPKTIREITDARRRLAFEELYLFQLQVSEHTPRRAMFPRPRFSSSAFLRMERTRA